MSSLSSIGQRRHPRHCQILAKSSGFKPGAALPREKRGGQPSTQVPEWWREKRTSGFVLAHKVRRGPFADLGRLTIGVRGSWLSVLCGKFLGEEKNMKMYQIGVLALLVATAAHAQRGGSETSGFPRGRNGVERIPAPPGVGPGFVPNYGGRNAPVGTYPGTTTDVISCHVSHVIDFSKDFGTAVQLDVPFTAFDAYLIRMNVNEKWVKSVLPDFDFTDGLKATESTFMHGTTEPVLDSYGYYGGYDYGTGRARRGTSGNSTIAGNSISPEHVHEFFPSWWKLKTPGMNPNNSLRELESLQQIRVKILRLMRDYKGKAVGLTTYVRNMQAADGDSAT